MSFSKVNAGKWVELEWRTSVTPVCQQKCIKSKRSDQKCPQSTLQLRDSKLRAIIRNNENSSY